MLEVGVHTGNERVVGKPESGDGNGGDSLRAAGEQIHPNRRSPLCRPRAHSFALTA